MIAWRQAAVGALLAAPSLGAQEPGPLPPGGFGTIRQEDVALRLETAALRLTVLPLDEHVLRLLARDSWSAMQSLVEAHREVIDEVARQAAVDRPSLFLVSFFGLERGVDFDADGLTVISRNRFFRPVATIPITPGWGTRRLEQRQTAVAIYLFEPGIATWEPMTISFEGRQNDQWERTLRRLDQERAAVFARAAAARPDSTDPPSPR